jgi:hypothetical protein
VDDADTCLDTLPHIMVASLAGVLHVSAAQVHSCMGRYEDLESVPAPALPSLSTLLAAANSEHTPSLSALLHPFGPGIKQHAPALVSVGLDHAGWRDIQHGSAGSSQPGASPADLQDGSAADNLMQEAFCLAAPPDNPAEDNGPLQNSHLRQSLQRSTARPAAASEYPTSRSSSRAAGIGGNRTAVQSAPAVRFTSTGNGTASSTGPSSTAVARSSTGPGVSAESLEQLELAACQHNTVVTEGSMREMLNASDALARTRRRRLLRLLRSTREARDSLVTALQASSPAQVLAALNSSFAGLTSLDDIQVEVCDEQGCVLVSLWQHGGSSSPAASVDTVDAQSAAAGPDWILITSDGECATSGAELMSWSVVGSSPLDCDRKCLSCLRFVHPMCASV